MKKDFLFFIEEIQSILSNIKDTENNKLKDLLIRHKRIFVIGAGRTGLVMQAFAMRLMHIGKEVFIIGNATTPSIGKDDLLVIGSGSGDTESLILAAEKAQKVGAVICIITASNGSKITKYSDFVININTEIIEKIENRKNILKQPMTTLFEQTLFLFLDFIVYEIIQVMSITENDMIARHANIE